MSAESDGSSAPAAIATSPVRGLTEQEVLARRARGEGNTAPPPASRSYWQIFSENVFTFINICLFGLGFALILLGRIGDALVSTGVILLNVAVSVVQEIRAKRTLDHIALLTRPTATVIRDGQQRSVSPDDLVIGDVLVLQPGDQIVVDGALAGDGHVEVDESLLTGESVPVSKRAGDRVYSGTYCTSGAARYVAEQVGEKSLAHQITTSAHAFRRVLTPLQQEIYLVIRIALLIVVYFEFLLVLISVLRQVNLAESVANSTIVAGLVPNGLFLSIAVAYALGATRILRFGALVQQSNAIESLSHVNVLCLDKTGTLTANRLQVDHLYPLESTEDALAATLGAIAASASSGNATTAAIAAAWPAPAHHVVAEVAFSSARKWSAVAFDDAPSETPTLRGIYALGAPELLRPYLQANNPASSIWTSISDQVRTIAGQGLRVLLVAHAPDPRTLEDHGDASRLPTGMQALGLLSLRDELRPEAREALAAFMQAGVRPKIISGDNPDTVAALAQQAGVASDAALISGAELDELNQDDFASTAESTTIFGRITPQQKARLVGALRDRGHYVAMIGDGVNDVLSLKQAQLAIAMHSGSQAARGVADVVLMHDSFEVLVPAVREGQRIINGMQDILKLFLARISTVGLVILSALVLGQFPLALRQGSLITLFSVGIPTVLLAVWAAPGPTPHVSLVHKLMHFIVPPVLATSVLALLLFVGTYTLRLSEAGALNAHLGSESHVPDALAAAETVLTAFLVVTGLLLVIFVKPPTPWWTGGSPLSADRRPTLLALGLLAAFALITLVPVLRRLFSLAPMDPQEYALVAGTAVVWLLVVRVLWRQRLLSRFLGIEV